MSAPSDAAHLEARRRMWAALWQKLLAPRPAPEAPREQ
jgi:hypothetical protein